MTDQTPMPTLSPLMGAMDFTQDDLDANRQGSLSSSQAENLKHTRQRNALIATAIFFVLVIVATSLLFFGQQNQSTILSVVGGLITVVNAVMVGMVGRSYLRTSADLRDGSVEVLQGQLERIVRPGRQQDNYVLQIDGERFFVTKEIFIHFRHEAAYRIYRTRWSKVLLSAEPMN